MNGPVTYLYDSSGRKLRQTLERENSLWMPGPDKPSGWNVLSVRDYCGNIIYENNRPSRVLIPGGYVELTDSVPAYRFFFNDHLGNVRAVTSEAGEVLQVNHYYPFGMLMGESSGGDEQPYKFGGKELTRDGGIDLCDFEARRMDNLRFLTPDRLSETDYPTSPYAFCQNNPMLYIDPTGKKTYLCATSLPGDWPLYGCATHTFLYVDNANVTGGNLKNSYFAYGSELDGLIGAVKGQLIRRCYEYDVETIEKFKTYEGDSRLKVKIEVPIPEGMSEDEFDKKIIDTAKSFGNEEGIRYFFIPIYDFQGNCNTSTSTILLKAGVSKSVLYNFQQKLPSTAVGFTTTPKPWTKEEQQKAIKENKQ